MKVAQYGATIVVMPTIVHGLHGFSTTMDYLA
jgi:phosphoglycerol transferase MdoB-like AlkP superfamily enzyme